MISYPPFPNWKSPVRSLTSPISMSSMERSCKWLSWRSLNDVSRSPFIINDVVVPALSPSPRARCDGDDVGEWGCACSLVASCGLLRLKCCGALSGESPWKLNGRCPLQTMNTGSNMVRTFRKIFNNKNVGFIHNVGILSTRLMNKKNKKLP